MKLLTIVGARPQFIKAAALSTAISKDPEIEEVILHTGQHFDKKMSDIFFDEMNIPKPRYSLNINSLSHGAMTGRMLESIEKIILEELPDYVVVYGDTNSTLAGALAASKLKINVAHIEAGLRSRNFSMPEEQNRILTDQLSSLLLCPSETAISNLKAEGLNNRKIICTGDIMFDAVKLFSSKIDHPQADSSYFLATIHRAENTDDKDRITAIVESINEVNNAVAPVIIPLHPRTRKKIADFGLSIEAKCIEPVGYIEMLSLIKGAKKVITDSGGLQKEAYFMGKQCIVIRDQTEWVELVEAGVNVLTGVNKSQIIEECSSPEKSNFPESVYGNADASLKIIASLKEHRYFSIY